MAALLLVSSTPLALAQAPASHPIIIVVPFAVGWNMDVEDTSWSLSISASLSS